MATPRTAVYGPVVWQGSVGNCCPYADLTRYALKCPTDSVPKMEFIAVSANTPSRIINFGKPMYVPRPESSSSLIGTRMDVESRPK